MRTMARILALVVGLGLSPAVSSDDGASLRLPDVTGGVGAGWSSELLEFSPVDVSLNGKLSVRVPLLFRRCFKLEPEIGLGYSGTDTGDLFLVRFGLSGFHTIWQGHLALSFGIGGGITYWSLSNGKSLGKVDFDLGPAMQVEYFFSEQFSLGVDVGLNYTHRSKWGDEIPAADNFSTRAGIFARFYFAAPKPPAEPEEPAEADEEAEATLGQKPEKREGARPTDQEEPEAGKPEEHEPAPVTPSMRTPACPAGTEKIGRAPPAGTEQYCARIDPGGEPVKHGWYMTWFENDQTAVRGEYKDDQRHGTWVFYHGNGRKRLDAQYREGEPIGLWIFWSQEGEKIREKRY